MQRADAALIGIHMRFIDLFAGLGGFHQALARLGHECVFASELDPVLADTYEKNFGIRPVGDIRIAHVDVPEHDVLCAGFPCQPFSKAGSQMGFSCPESGDLFEYVLKIVQERQPEFIILENVPNLIKHNKGETWKSINNHLSAAGYDIDSRKVSPHRLGIPHARERAFIVGRRSSLKGFEWPHQNDGKACSIRTILDKMPNDARALPDSFVGYLEAWQDLLDKLPRANELPTFPIWAAEFGATYPIDGQPPLSRQTKELSRYRGAFGESLRGLTGEALRVALPPYARTTIPLPAWKQRFLEQNRAFYIQNKAIIDPWLPSIRSFAPSFQKLEWNWKGGPRDFNEAIIQFRASGIRAKKPSTSPSLVALTTSQIPVVGWEHRYMTMRECARLQSMGGLVHFPPGEGRTFKALGNAVNVDAVYAIAAKLLTTDDQPDDALNTKVHDRASEARPPVAIANL